MLSLRSPAFIVLALAVVILAGGILASVLAGGPTSHKDVQTVTLNDGTVVTVTAGTKALAPVEQAGLPPRDILQALGVPKGSTVASSVNTDQDQTQYDRTVNFATSMTPDQVRSFYETLLPRLGWKVAADGPDPYHLDSTEVLAKKGSSDGYYWEVGVVVSPETSAGVTPFSVRLFEVSDVN